MKNREQNLYEARTCNSIKADVKRSFWHNVTRIVGGTYYEAKTDTTYWYAGYIKLWLDCKWNDIKKLFFLRYYDVRIWWLKNCSQRYNVPSGQESEQLFCDACGKQKEDNLDHCTCYEGNEWIKKAK